jgi:hypothetical protein
MCLSWLLWYGLVLIGGNMEYFAAGLIVVLVCWFLAWIGTEAFDGNKIALVLLVLSLSAIIGWSIWLAEKEANANRVSHHNYCQDGNSEK